MIARHRQLLPETIALARPAEAVDALQLSADAIIARDMARRLFAALKARTGAEVDAFLDHSAKEIVDPAYDAADRLYRKSRIYVEPLSRGFFSDLFSDRRVYLVAYPDGTQRHVTEPELLAMAGVSVPA